MKTESQLTSRRMQKLTKEELPGAVWLKMNDRSRAMPADGALLYSGRCLWIEFKRLTDHVGTLPPPAEQVVRALRPSQDAMLRKLQLPPVSADVLVYVFTPRGDFLYRYAVEGTLQLRTLYTHNLAEYLNDLAN